MRRLCCSYVDLIGLRALLSCQLIALNKNPGVRPIAIWRDVLKNNVQSYSLSLEA